MEATDSHGSNSYPFSPTQSKQNISAEKRLSKAIAQQQEEEMKRFQAQQKNEYKYIKARLKRV